MGILVLLNNFMHDFSAAGWLFGAVLLWLARRSHVSTTSWSRDLRITLRHIRRLMLWCLTGIVVCGAVRALAYRTYEWSEAAGSAQVTVLIVKHVLLTLVFLAGLREFLRVGRILRQEPDETA